MKLIWNAYKKILKILYSESPFVVISTFLSALLTGLLSAISIWVNSRIFDMGLAVSQGEVSFQAYIPYLLLFVAAVLLPVLVGDLFIDSYVEPRSQLIFRTVLKGQMLEKLKQMRYSHLENSESMEVIDKAYNRTENSVRHLFPRYIKISVTAFVATVGILYLFASVRWWLLLTILIPFIIETKFNLSQNYNIYNEMEKYWLQERKYTILGDMLKTRKYVTENKLLQCADYLIKIYRTRMRDRNKEYEKYYVTHLLRQFVYQNITRFAQIGNAVLLLWLYTKGEISLGLLISLTAALFATMYSLKGLPGCAVLFKYAGFHIKAFEYYDKYFELEEDEYGDVDILPADMTIEFDNVYFTYPGTESEILSGVNFTVKNGEKISVVGRNGEGKSTIVKLLLGLFKPDKGEIRVGGIPLRAYTQDARKKMFGSVLQDFGKYSVTMRENIGIGDIDNIENDLDINTAIEKAKLQKVVSNLPDGLESLLGRDFDGGVDLSGGQWQRIAIARAFMGQRQVMIMDEPTSQLDPIAESRLYTEFAEMVEGRTAILISHRLGSTKITDRIIVIEKGRVAQSGSHDELVKQQGLYAEMFESQKQWYI